MVAASNVEETRFAISSKRDLVFGFGLPTFFLVFSAVGLLWALGLIPVSGTMRPTSFAAWVGCVTMIVLGTCALYLGLSHALNPYAVILMRDGGVVFRSVLRSATITAAAITRIERTVAPLVMELDDPRRLWIHHADRKTVIDYFDGIERLMAELVKCNPAIAVSGIWPAS